MNLQQQTDQMRQIAYELFETAGMPEQEHRNHWLKAERLFQSGTQELINTAVALEATIALPGFVPSEIDGRIRPDTLLVPAATPLLADDELGTSQVQFCRFLLPQWSDTSRVTAHLKKGVLPMVALKATAPQQSLSYATAA